MARRKTYRLGDQQLRIMKILWERGTATVAEVHRELASETPVAYTTVATMLRKMEARRLVRHRRSDRKFIYRPAVPAADVTRSMSEHILDRLFQGSLADMVHHLLTTCEVSDEELGRLERLIAARRREQ